MNPIVDRRTVLTSGVLGGAAILTGCDVSEIPFDPRRLTVVFSQDVGQLDPAASLALSELAASQAAYQRLLAPVVENGALVRLQGDLATQWIWADDKSSITFSLDPAARFSDGSKVTSKAVKFSLDRIAKQKLTASQALFWLADIETPNDLTVIFRLGLYMPFIEHILWHPGMSIINPAVEQFAIDGDQGTAWLRENSAGSGSYQFANFSPRSDVVLRPNPHSSQQPEYFTEVVIRTVRDVSARSMQMAAGDADIVEFITSQQARWLSTKENVEIESGPSASVIYLYLNTERPLLSDPLVRKAISLAIDRELLLESIYEGDGELMHGLIPEGIPGYDLTIPQETFDPGRARELLRDAGVAEGTKLTITGITDSGTPSVTTLAIREFLSAIGFDMEVREISTGARSQIVAGDFDMISQALSFDFPDPWILFNFALNSQTIGASNYSRYSNPRVDALVQRADQSEPETRALLYARAQRMVLEDMPIIPLLRMNWSYALRSDIVGGNYNFSVPQTHDFKHMRRTTT